MQQDPEVVDEAVYRLLELVPSSRVISYGEAAAQLGLATARRPAAAMTRAPEGLPWWRMIRADGSLPPPLARRAGAQWQREGTPVVGQGPHPRAARAAFLVPDAAWRHALEEALASLPRC